MSRMRVERCREYANPRRRENWDGESTADNISRWSKRAAENSTLAPRAKGGEMRLPETGGDVALHDTEAKPRRDAGADARAKAKADTNTDGGSSFMKSIRRKA
ncbi:hypothetical protein ABIB73_000108 [Bradyrhizobium sp. F1.4.3]